MRSVQWQWRQSHQNLHYMTFGCLFVSGKLLAWNWRCRLQHVVVAGQFCNQDAKLESERDSDVHLIHTIKYILDQTHKSQQGSDCGPAGVSTREWFSHVGVNQPASRSRSCPELWASQQKQLPFVRVLRNCRQARARVEWHQHYDDGNKHYYYHRRHHQRSLLQCCFVSQSLQWLARQCNVKQVQAQEGSRIVGSIEINHRRALRCEGLGSLAR